MEEKFKECRIYFDTLAALLKPLGYEVVASCNADLSAYLVPAGTKDQITYYGKPELSFRVSDHWNWYSNLKKCSDPNEVQCWSEDVASPRKRDIKEPNKATKPRHACQVAFYGQDHRYHCIFGEKFVWPGNHYIWYKEPVMGIVEMIKDRMSGGNENE